MVGIGASAGGITALRAFCEALPADANMALVVIVHLDPKAHSTLPDLIALHAKVRVRLAEDGMLIEPRNIYVIPPGHDLSIRDGHLAVTPQDTARIRLPIDHFLRSLAGSFHDRAVAVILSGSGTDGSLGVRTIKEEGGLTIVQSPEEAEYDNMPRAAIGTGAVDRIVLVREIPAALVDYGRRRPIIVPPSEEEAPPEAEGTLADVVALLRRAKGHDFSPYKPGTLTRRLARRMAINQCEKPADYLKLLRDSPEEVDALYKDMLINVTGFFRDTDAFAYLRRHVIPEIVKGQTGETPVRVWVPGCSSGEEAYSLGILLIEALTAANKPPRLQIFATDVDLDALEDARRGVYPDSIGSDVSSARLARFFTQEDRHYVVRPFLRECVIVSAQNLLADPPFSALDLISCRNLLIYLKPEVQDQVLSLCHFGLRPGGILFLGSSENVRNEHTSFEPVSAKHRIFRRIGRRRVADVGLLGAQGARGHARLQPTTNVRATSDLVALGQRLLVDTYTPPSAIVDGRNQAQYFLGAIDHFLRVAGGEASHDVISLAREGLRAKLRSALDQARQGDGHALVEGALLERDGRSVSVNIAVNPLRSNEEQFYLVTFLEAPLSRPAETAAEPSPEEAGRIAELEQELTATRAELQSMVHDLESANEELRAANEEAMSVNEEFQSTNEELETSKEELQSLNEELTTVNAQLQERVEAQRKAAADLDNILSSADIATMFLDPEMRIRFFTPAVRNLFPIVSSDIGRSLADFVGQLHDPGLLNDAANVLETLAPIKFEIETGRGTWFSRRVVPYRTGDNRIEGVVVTYVHVSEVKRAERAARAAQHYVENIIDTVREPLLVLDEQLNVVSASRAFYSTFQLRPAEVERRPVGSIGEGSIDFAPLVKVLGTILPEKHAIENVEIEAEVAARGTRVFALNAREIAPEETDGRLILVALEDWTSERHAAERLYHDFMNATPDAVVIVDEQGRIRDTNVVLDSIFGYRQEELAGQPIDILIPERFHERHHGHVAAFFAAPRNRLMGESLGLEIVGRRKDGTERPLQVALAVLRGADGPLAVASIRELTEQKKTERELEEAKIAAERANSLKTQFLEATGRNLIRPLQTIGLLTGILGRTVAKRDAQDTVGRLDMIVGRLTDSLNLLLDVSRLESGTVVPQLADFPIHATIERMRTEFGRAARSRELDFRVVSSNAVVHSDRQILDRILQNFVSNALRYTRTGKVLVGCRRRGGRLRIEVWDTGLGIPEDELGRIFGEYERVTRPESELEQGLGLGLYVAKRLADLMNDRIEVHSIAGKGSVFMLEVPLVATAAKEVPAPAEAVETRRGPVGVLVVSSNAESRRFLEVLLRLEGYGVRVAAGMADIPALLAAPGFNLDCAIVEENLGDDFSGGGVVWSLNRQVGNRLAALVLTDNPSAEYAEEMLDGGAVALVKPVKAGDIVAHVAGVLRESGLSAERPVAPAPRPAGRRAQAADPRPLVAVATGNPGLAKDIAYILNEGGRRTDLFRSSDELLACVASDPPSCVVLGVRLPGLPTVEIMERLRSDASGEIPVILVGGPGSVTDAVTGMRAGAVEVLEAVRPPGWTEGGLLQVAPAQLIEAVERGLAQRSPAVERAHAVAEARNRLQHLTAREREIASLLAGGHSNKEIAAQLGLSQRTVENHRAQIRAKTRVRSLADLVRLLELIQG